MPPGSRAFTGLVGAESMFSTWPQAGVLTHSTPEVSLTCRSRSAHRIFSARWGASCPRQGISHPAVRPTRSNLLPAWRSADLRQFRRKVMPRPPHARSHARRPQERSEALAESASARTMRTRAIASCARCPNASPTPTLRDVQLALAREFGLDGWTTLKHDRRRSARLQRALTLPVAGRGGLALPRQRLSRSSRARRIRSCPCRAHGDAPARRAIRKSRPRTSTRRSSAAISTR